MRCHLQVKIYRISSSHFDTVLAGDIEDVSGSKRSFSSLDIFGEVRDGWGAVSLFRPRTLAETLCRVGEVCFSILLLPTKRQRDDT